jgi:tRNA 2-selenouridine synthase SelU
MDLENNEWKQPDNGTQDLFLNKLTLLLKEYYDTDWEFQWELEDGWVDLKIQFPSEKGE